jgi:hypothetical protein
VSLEVIGVMLGHEDYNTTRCYVSLDDRDIADAHEAASPFEAFMGRATAPIDLTKRRKRYDNQKAG